LEETLESVNTLAELAGDGNVLELAIGTGRVALPQRHPRGNRRYGQGSRGRRFRPGLPGVQYDLQLDHTGRSDTMLQKCGRTPQ